MPPVFRLSASPVDCASSFFSQPGETSCRKCGAGKFSDMPGSSKCTTCPGGYYQSIVGSESCESCNAGMYSIVKERNPDGVINGAGCTPCAPGTYSKSRAVGCLVCPQGYFQDRPGSMKCKQWGWIKSSRGETRCQMCPPHTYVMRNASVEVCAKCPGCTHMNPQCGTCAPESGFALSDGFWSPQLSL